MGQRYWRGPVFEATNGRHWWASRGRDTVPNLELRNRPITYTITLEPHQHRWLFALEMPSATTEIGSLEPDLQLLARRPITQRLRYRLTSYLDYRVTTLSSAARRRNLELPADANPRARALATSWTETAGNPKALVSRLLTYLREEPFYYTLTPPLLDKQAVDDFLFHTRRGYCEHYASAATFLLRAGGVPARVVTGYLGGEYNPLGGYLLVRQMDAHAWVEAWLGDDDGWVRIDPTAVLPPERVNRDQTSWSEQPSRVLTLVTGPSIGMMAEVWRGLYRGWDAVNNHWNQWVLGYGTQRRDELLERLGLHGLSGEAIALLMGGMVLLFLGGLMLQLMIRSTRSRDPLLMDWESFCRRLARAGIPRRPDEGPLAYAERVAVARPDLAHRVSLVARLYARLRYGRTAPKSWRRHLRRLMRS
ncbi:protein-glutamine gamma-glutamyltransferase [Gammaproteobacteria bacterium]